MGREYIRAALEPLLACTLLVALSTFTAARQGLLGQSFWLEGLSGLVGML
jgi:hypothetical protein